MDKIKLGTKSYTKFFRKARKLGYQKSFHGTQNWLISQKNHKKY